MSGLDFDLDALEAELREGKIGKLGEIVGLALITRLRAAEARTAWQAIETAPMGERVLALMDGLTIIAARGMLGWYDDDDRRVSVTAWAPLPAAPEAP